MNLFIDTHLDNIVIILFDKTKIIKQGEIKGEKQNSKLIMSTVKKVLDKKKPESIIVVNGPGSFTGVRLAVTIAKAFAYTLEIPIRTISSLECMALSTDEEEKIVAFSDKNGYYIGVFDNEYNLIGNYEYLSSSEFAQYMKIHNVITDVSLDYTKIIEYTLKKKPLNPHEVNPIYIKKLDVEK